MLSHISLEFVADAFEHFEQTKSNRPSMLASIASRVDSHSNHGDVVEESSTLPLVLMALCAKKTSKLMSPKKPVKGKRGSKKLTREDIRQQRRWSKGSKRKAAH